MLATALSSGRASGLCRPHHCLVGGPQGFGGCRKGTQQNINIITQSPQDEHQHYCAAILSNKWMPISQPLHRSRLFSFSTQLFLLMQNFNLHRYNILSLVYIVAFKVYIFRAMFIGKLFVWIVLLFIYINHDILNYLI